MEIKDDIINFSIKSVEKKGYFECTNQNLADKVYEILKPKYPTLYKYKNNQMIYVEIIKLNRYNELIIKKDELLEELEEILLILNELNK